MGPAVTNSIGIVYDGDYRGSGSCNGDWMSLVDDLVEADGSSELGWPVAVRGWEEVLAQGDGKMVLVQWWGCDGGCLQVGGEIRG